MLDRETLQKLQDASIADRIMLIEVLLQSLPKDTSESTDIRLINGWVLQRNENQGSVSSPENLFTKYQSQLTSSSNLQPQRPPFGYMKGTGVIQGDIISPAVPESDWEVLQ